MENLQLSDNFSLKELCKSDTASRLNIDNIPTDEVTVENLKDVSINILQPIRDHFGIPFTPNSGYRSPDLNKAIGSSNKSQHCKGEAVDIEIPTIDNSELALWVHNNLVYDQLILEFYTQGEPNSGWVHVSFKKDANRMQPLTYDGKNYSIGLSI